MHNSQARLHTTLFHLHFYRVFGFFTVRRLQADHAGNVAVRLLVNRLGMAERFESIKAMVGAHATRTHAAKRQFFLGNMHNHVVERHTA